MIGVKNPINIGLGIVVYSLKSTFFLIPSLEAQSFAISCNIA